MHTTESNEWAIQTTNQQPKFDSYSFNQKSINKIIVSFSLPSVIIVSKCTFVEKLLKNKLLL